MSHLQKNMFIILGSKKQNITHDNKNPYQKGILLQRQLRVNYDKLYDPYDLDDLSQNIYGYRHQAEKINGLIETEMEGVEQGIPKLIACEICLNRHQVSLFADCNNISKDAMNIETQKKQSSSKEDDDAPMIAETISSEHTIYYTCLSQDIEQNMTQNRESYENQNKVSMQTKEKQYEP